MTAIAAGPGLGAVGLPTVSVTTPTLPVTTPTLPVTTPTVTLPTPPPPPPSPPPTPPPPSPVTAPSVTVPHVGLPQLAPPPPAAGSSGPASSAPGSPGSAAPRSGASRPGGSSNTASRPLRLNARHRSTLFVFHLAEPGRVRVTFREVRCGGTASLTLHGHRGLNRVRFTGRIGRHRLAPGTYRIRVRSHGRTLLRKTLVVGDGLASCIVERELDAVSFPGATLF